jgi:hypothetical protein
MEALGLMEEVLIFPEWIMAVEKSDGHKLNTVSRDFFKKSMEIYPNFREAYANCPETSEIGILKNHDPCVLEDHYEKSTLAYFIIANISETLHYQFLYQTRELALAFHSALERGMFYTAATLHRSIFESVCIYYYTLSRVEKKYKESEGLLASIAKTKSNSEKSKLTPKYYNILYDIYSLVFRANTATSLDWGDYLKKFGYTGDGSHNSSDRIHVNTAIEDLAKKSKLPLQDAYNLMSEFVHPNYGSKTLVIRTARPHQKYMDVVALGDNFENPEAALFYLDNFSESLFYTLTLACSLNERSIRFLDKVFKLISEVNKEKGH